MPICNSMSQGWLAECCILHKWLIAGSYLDAKALLPAVLHVNQWLIGKQVCPWECNYPTYLYDWCVSATAGVDERSNQWGARSWKAEPKFGHCCSAIG